MGAGPLATTLAKIRLKVFGKLGIRSRRELATALAESELVAA